MFVKQSTDVLRIQIPTEKYPGALLEAEFCSIMNSIVQKINDLFSDTKDLQQKRIKNALECIFSHSPLVPLSIPVLLHYSFFRSKHSHNFKMEQTAQPSSCCCHDTKKVKMADNEHRPITQSSSTPGHRQLP